jgi:alcohol dehydrogenase
MQSFDYSQRTRFVFGAGKLDQLGKLARELGASRVLLVSDSGVVQAGHFARGRERLEEAGLVTAAFHDLQENPTTRHVESGLTVARDFRPDLLVGLGGGSSMDCAKGINFLYSCGGQMRDYWGVGKATGPLLPMIAVPTTAGTGSEAQSFALISDAETHVKMACGDPRAACRIALLDPELTLTQPPRVTALTGVDALTHALETLVTRRRTAVSLAFSHQAWQLIAASLRVVIESPTDLEARGRMQLGAAMAGMAIEASMLGAAHALANPLTARFQIAHGQAVGLMLPHVIRFNGQEASAQAAYRQAASEIELAGDEASESLARWLTEMLTIAGLKTRLDELQVPSEAIGELAQDAARQWTASFNPRAVDEESLRTLYAAAFRA